jgi:hypothetical protein
VEFTKVIVGKLGEHEKQLDGQIKHRALTGFLSRTREERESEILESRITILKEDKESLVSERNALERSHQEMRAELSKVTEERSA